MFLFLIETVLLSKSFEHKYFVCQPSTEYKYYFTLSALSPFCGTQNIGKAG